MESFDRLRSEIDAHIAARLEELPGELGVEVSVNGADVLARLREFALRPGKRIRGALTVVAYEMFGGRERSVALEAALAMELVQNYLLIVDDVMDRSAMRRGGPTVQVQYARELARERPAGSASANAAADEHLANMIAINAGLIDHHLSMLVLSGVGAPAERVVRAQRLFQTNIAATGFGQMDDLFNEAGRSMSYDDVRHMYMLKSSYYSFVCPLQLGAVLAGAMDGGGVQGGPSRALPGAKPKREARPGQPVLDALRVFGEQAGLAFQLQDDILGMFGDAKVTGKSAMDDLREGKRTLLVRHGLDHADAAQRRVLDAAFGNPKVTVRQHAAVKQVLEATGSRVYVADEAQAAARRALDLLAGQDWDANGKRLLAEMVEYIITRQA